MNNFKIFEMKKLKHGSAWMIIFCLAITELSIAQSPPPPAPPVKPKALKDPDNTNQNNGDETVIVIHKKSDKNIKLNIETKDGEVFINGKPLDKYDDKDIIIEKKNPDDDDLALSLSSPFRERELADISRRNAEDVMRDHQEWAEAARINADDISRSQRDMQKQMQKTITLRMNSAFLGISSRKTDKGGATVLEVTKGSPAEKAGIKTGDIITKVNDIKIDNPDVLFETIHNFKPGDKVKIFYLRDGKQIGSLVTLDKSEPMTRTYNYKYTVPPIPPLPEMREFRFRTWDDRPKLGIKAQDAEDGKGVNILEVEDSSAAANAGLKKGDIITQFDGKDVNSANDLVDEFQGAREKSIVKVKIIRSGNPQEIVVKIPRKLKTAEL
jgi:serine protease Do